MSDSPSQPAALPSPHQPATPVSPSQPAAPDLPVQPAAPASPIDPGSIAIEATAVSTVSYPMAHNRIAVLGPVRITCRGAGAMGALVTVTLQDDIGMLGSGTALVDLPAHGATVLSTPPSPLDPAAMARVDHQCDGRLQVTVTIGDQTVAERSFPVTILAAQQWLARPPMLGLEMLAAFVMPHHPAIAALVGRATDRLATSTGSGALAGYQVGPQRIDQVAAAVFDALRDIRIQSVEPPSGWATEGQQVRTPDQVLGERIGTCLDVALVHAAALELAGLHPLVWLLPGRAFVGYWRAERSLQAAATTEPDGLINLVDLDLIRLVDPALATADAQAATGHGSPTGTTGSGMSPDDGPSGEDGPTRAPIEPDARAVSAAALRATLLAPPAPSGAADTTVGVVDIRAARRDLILPLPARVAGADGAVTVIDYQPASPSDDRATGPDGTAGAPAPNTGPTPNTAGSKPIRATTTSPVAPPRIAAWKNALLDLSMRNRLLNYSTRSGVRLEVPPGMLASLEDIVMEGGAITLLPADQVGGVQEQRGIRFGRELTEGQRADLIATRRSVYCDVASDGYDTRMRRLAYRVRTIAEETGANNLYLALGSLVWTLPESSTRPSASSSSTRPTVSNSSVQPTVSNSSVQPTVSNSSVRPTVPNSSVRPMAPNSSVQPMAPNSSVQPTAPNQPAPHQPATDQPLRSPLVLIPVRLTTRARRGVYRIELDEAGISTPNYCLLEKLRQVHGLTVPGLAEPAVDSSGIDLDAAFRALRTALADADLPYRVEQTADLAVLAFAKFRLWKDLDDAWAELLASPLGTHLATAPTETFVDPAATMSGDQPDLDELATRCPVPADASQLDAVAAAVAGQTFVLEGPPGTGKSQTITNILAGAMASGKRVLFVAEKRAALDVVTRRLAAVGLQPYCLDLHDKGAKPAAVRATIRVALDAHQQADRQGLAADTERVRSSAGQLGRYAARLHERNGAGLSYYSAHTQALAVGPGASLSVPEELVASGRGLAEVRRAMATLPDAADPARPRHHHPWGFVDPADPAGADPGAIAAAADELTAELTGWWDGTPLAEPLTAIRQPGEMSTLAMFAGTWAQDLALIDEAATRRWHSAAEDARVRVDTFVAARHPELDLVRPDALGLPLEDIDRDARAATSSSWFGRRKRQLAVVARFDGVLRDGATIPRKQIAELSEALVRLSRSLAELQTAVSAVPGLTTPLGWNPLLAADRAWLDDRIGWLTWAGATASLRDPAGRLIAEPEPFRVALRRLLESRAVIADAERESLDRLASAVSRLAGLVGGDEAFRSWASGGLLATWAGTAAERAADPAGLRRYLGLITHLLPLRAAGLTEARRTLLDGKVPAADALRAMDSGIAAASIRERSAATGLTSFDPVAQGGAVATFVSASARVRDHLVTAIPAGLVADRRFDPTSGYGRIGELTRELAKQRRGLTVRGLMTRYGDLITAIMPCTLVSPDSLARFFPPRHDLFDLVVFDEASQIRVADAVGALGRASAAVVVGDSKQMPPTSFAESSWVETGGGATDLDNDSDVDDPDDLGLTAVQDEESILAECVQSGLARRWLSWHYRSQDETLIAFSNRRYYSDRLSSFPSPVSAVADPSIDGHGVNLVRVDGRFLRSGSGKSLRTNPIEAIAVVTEIRQRFAASPVDTPSIGVVTFNAQQRTHIEALLRDLHDDRITEALDRTDGEGLFVKNLENVQGDERDVILFSTAFSTNARGVLPLNFGPLNQVGGERRLNVAITRARRQVIVFSSFDPEDLRAEETTSQGIKDLRAYLELARSGSGDTVGVSPRAPARDRHRDEIAAALRDRGLSVATNVGLSDFTIDLAIGPGGVDGSGENVRPDRVAVLLDGPSWAARRTVGDRDGLPVDVLARLMGWPRVERVWLPEWLQDRQGVIDRLHAAAVAALAAAVEALAPAATAEEVGTPTQVPSPEPATPPEQAPSVPSSGQPSPAGSTGPALSLFSLDDDHALGPDHPVPPVEPAADSAHLSETPLPGEAAFAPWRSGYLGGRDVLDALPGSAAADRVTRALAAGIEAEGPIHTDRLARLVAGGFDLGRISTDRRTAILACLPPEALRDSADRAFAWPAGADPASWSGFRRTGPTDDRPLEHVSPVEIGNAMAALCVAGAGLDRDQLFARTLLIFGFRRRTSAQLALLEAALTRAVSMGRLRVDESVVVATAG